MRRLVVVLAALTAGAISRAPAQSLRLVATIDSTNVPNIRLFNLFEAERWRNALDQNLPIRLHWRLQLWRSRAGFDSPGPSIEWDVMIRREPLLEQYRFTEESRGRRVTDTSFVTLDELRFYYERGLRVGNASPATDGNWYYRATVEVRTLNENDIDRMQRLPGGADPGGGLGATIGRLLMSLGLPSDNLSDETPVFRFRRRR